MQSDDEGKRIQPSAQFKTGHFPPGFDFLAMHRSCEIAFIYIYSLSCCCSFREKKILCESCNLWFVWLLNNQVLIQRLTILVSVHYQLFKKDFFAVKVNTMQYLLASGWNFLKLEASNCHLLGVFSNESLNRNDYFCSVVGSV